jgi:1-aminocyclopropane-1-carboxylate deaminase
MSSITFENTRIDSIGSICNFHTIIDVLRLDLLHPLISGNKWFKLKEYLTEAKKLNKDTIITFGGSYSNHIVATAAAANMEEFKSIGIIRGEAPLFLSPTLKDAEKFGMQLYFIPREQYSSKKLPEEIENKEIFKNYFIINAGGYGELGAKGAQSILALVDKEKYSHVITAVGTGTTFAGLINATSINQKIIGINVLKNNYSIVDEIKHLLIDSGKNNFELINDYHFGGYAKKTPELISFMNNWYERTGIPSDFIYTGKLFYAVNNLILKNYFPLNSKILIIHSGGLQGNRSLSKGTLIFS